MPRRDRKNEYVAHHTSGYQGEVQRTDDPASNKNPKDANMNPATGGLIPNFLDAYVSPNPAGNGRADRGNGPYSGNPGSGKGSGKRGYARDLPPGINPDVYNWFSLKSKKKWIAADPRVNSKWVSSAISDQYQEFIKNRDMQLKQQTRENMKREKKLMRDALEAVCGGEVPAEAEMLDADMLDAAVEAAEADLDVAGASPKAASTPKKAPASDDFVMLDENEDDVDKEIIKSAEKLQNLSLTQKADSLALSASSAHGIPSIESLTELGKFRAYVADEFAKGLVNELCKLQRIDSPWVEEEENGEENKYDMTLRIDS
jgi:hypothetical protein